MSKFFCILCYLSFLLLIGNLIKSKFKIFQKYYIPASVIAGVFGLFFSEQIFGKFTDYIIPLSWNSEIKNIPSILIIPIITAIPLGVDFSVKGKKGTHDVSLTALILLIVTAVQLSLGYFVNLLFTKIFHVNLYKTFGVELNSGFAGGHGTAGLIGRISKDINLQYWNISQGVATTMATFGLIGGLILGIFLVNKAFKNGEIKNPPLLDNTSSKDIDSFNSNKTSFTSIIFHLMLIFIACKTGILISHTLKIYKIPVLSSISVWIVSMLVMLCIWIIIKKLKLNFLINMKLKNKISSIFTEFAIVSAITTLPLKAIFLHIIPIATLTILGFITTWIIIKYYTYKYFQDFKFERAISMTGTSLGVFLTGVLLLKMCDPKFTTPVLKDYSVGFAITAFFGPMLIELSIITACNYGPIVSLILFLTLSLILTFFIKRISNL